MALLSSVMTFKSWFRSPNAMKRNNVLKNWTKVSAACRRYAFKLLVKIRPHHILCHRHSAQFSSSDKVYKCEENSQVKKAHLVLQPGSPWRQAWVQLLEQQPESTTDCRSESRSGRESESTRDYESESRLDCESGSRTECESESGSLKVSSLN